MKVREMIAELQKHDPGAEVRVETACLYEGDPEILISMPKRLAAHRTGYGRIDRASVNQVCIYTDGLSEEDKAELRKQDPEGFDEDEEG